MIENQTIRLGIIYPTGGGEQDYYKYAESTNGQVRIFLVTTRLYGDDKDHDVDALLRSGNVDTLRIAGAKLRELSPGSVIWACTSASFVGGLQWSRDQASAISEGANCPASTTSLAFSNALDAIGASTVAVMASYPETVGVRFKAFLEERGKKVEKLHCLDVMSGWDAARIPADEMIAAVRCADCPEAQALLIPDTAIPTFHLIEQLEAEIGKPVLTANQVSLWEGLRLAGTVPVRPELGRLFC
jgi:maleate cis-trans isomerase